MGSPFGIRKKLKAALKGRSSTPRREEASAPPPEPFTITVVENDGSEQSTRGNAPAGLILSTFALDEPLRSGCRDSSCGTCRVEVLEGAELLSPQGDEERRTLAAKGHDGALRLACRIRILGGGTIRVRAVERVVPE